MPSPLVGEGGSAHSAEPDEGCWKERGGGNVEAIFKHLRHQGSDPSNTPHPTELRSATFSHKETFAQKPIGDSVMMVEAGRFGMA
ncbi:hypothetical protein NKI34_30060, partial [Mesorhizobium sp. M0700]